MYPVRIFITISQGETSKYRGVTPLQIILLFCFSNDERRSRLAAYIDRIITIKSGFVTGLTDSRELVMMTM